ncbi:hypothetical protein Tco_1421655 [Tanacetum coccineum]
MATMTKNVIAAGSETHPPMLEKGMYDSWKTRIMLYIRGEENGEMLRDLVENDPYQLKNQATIQNGQAMVQNIQGRQSQGYTSNAKNNQALGAWVISVVGNTGVNQPRVIRCYNCKGKGHMAKPYEQQQDFLAVCLEDIDDCEELQLQATTNFKADHVDAYDSDCDDEATANAIFMENLSHVGSLNDYTVAPRYDSDTLSELNGNSDVISYTDYMLTIGDDANTYVPHPVQKSDMMLSVIEQMNLKLKTVTR